MSWGGAVIGGIIGGIFGGPWGAAIGAVVGGLSGNDDAKDSPSVETGKSEESDGRLELEMWETLFRAFGRLAKSDGVVSREEADLVGAFLRKTGLPSPLRKQLIAAFNAGKADKRPFHMLVADVAACFRDDARPDIMTALSSIVLADGAINARELEMLREAERILKQPGFVDRWLRNVNGERRREPEPKHADDLSWAYQQLNLSPECSDDDVKKAWRNKAKEFHPDLLRGKGVEESVIRLAEDQMRRVNTAYEQIKKTRGF